jgi:hypothetical protein
MTTVPPAPVPHREGRRATAAPFLGGTLLSFATFGVVLRLTQGVSTGGEAAGATRWAPHHERIFVTLMQTPETTAAAGPAVAQPLQLGPITLRNRFVGFPHGTQLRIPGSGRRPTPCTGTACCSAWS